ncbi:30S ribosomal protein S6--L-glutamate ligase [Phaeocystidibacter luteus]|uniref:Probable alpha-L-glutamate ligase n=1 Tax=Phaeocystidibacter luteus TaxID=911197 RepID=A0A6N6RIV6_9FLAO|nr:30S ribosomal protein S6--L-glutamate ligase [Phaeocystidibacter luteus]KAB2814270.1 30S ribosomal protein S6--L-glutamate ligase [Phaeocystidibacter luteus]
MNLVILSANKNLYSTKRLVEAAEARGHTVSIINHTRTYVVMESGNLDIYYGDHVISDVDAIIPRIGASVTYYGSAMIRQFEMRQVFTTVSSLALVRSRDKLRATQILARHGVGIPKTAFAKQPNDVDSLIKQVGGTPLIVKLLEGTQGLGVVLAETRKAAKSVIEAFYGLNANILVQEFIEEAGGADIRAVVVGGKVVAAYKRQGKEGEFRSNIHRGGSGAKVRLTKAEKDMAVKAARALGLHVAGVDMLQSKRGPLILEVNSSPGLKGIESTTGVDVASIIIEYIEKNYNKSPGAKKDKVGA